jgi:hypothetical protein
MSFIKVIKVIYVTAIREPPNNSVLSNAKSTGTPALAPKEHQGLVMSCPPFVTRTICPIGQIGLK